MLSCKYKGRPDGLCIQILIELCDCFKLTLLSAIAGEKLAFGLMAEEVGNI